MRNVLSALFALIVTAAAAGPADWIGPTVDPTNCSINQAITYQGPVDALGCVAPSSMGPQPAGTVPPSDTAVGAVGAAATFVRSDAIRPARYRAGSCVIAGGGGQCTITWSTAFSGTPQALGDPAAINTNFATAQYNCNWISVSSTTGVVGCRSSVLGLAILGTILSFITNGVTVYGTAVMPL